MKKSHVWDVLEIVDARCPYCGAESEYHGYFACEGDKLECKVCNKKFELGRQK